jgi:hypothetical protein
MLFFGGQEKDRQSARIPFVQWDPYVDDIFSTCLPLNCHPVSKMPSHQQLRWRIFKFGARDMAYKIVAEKDDQIVRAERDSLLIAIAKARVWTSEGWHVVVTDDDGKALDPAEFDKLLAA